jgi:hypothetical protein
MALSQVQVVNLALTKLGQDRVTSISDDVEQARVMRSLWDMTRDAVLASYPWKFAIVSAELPALADAPTASDWTLQYELPETCLRLVQVGNSSAFYSRSTETFSLQGGLILTDEPAPLRVRYVSRVESVGLWPVLFGRAVAMQLACDAAEKLTNSSAKYENCLQAFVIAIREARRQNAIERPPQGVDDSDWLSARDD